MSWALEWDDEWNRDVGYGVPAYCDHPGCDKKIHRGLSFVCGGDVYGGDHGCGLHFCRKHLWHHSFQDGNYVQVCKRCDTYKPYYKPKPDHPEWVAWKLFDESWEDWREANPEWVKQQREHYGLRLSEFEAFVREPY